MVQKHEIVRSAVQYLTIAVLVLWAYNLGTFFPRLVTPSQGDITRYMEMNNHGCDDIIEAKNAYTGNFDTVCEVQLNSPHENIYIVKGDN